MNEPQPPLDSVEALIQASGHTYDDAAIILQNLHALGWDITIFLTPEQRKNFYDALDQS